jgi:hypothetical protein
MTGVRISIPCVAILAMLAAASCGGNAESPTPAERSTANSGPSLDSREAKMSDDLTIQSGTQAHLDSVAIGVGNCWEAEFTRADGSKPAGPSCALWVSVKDDPAGGRSLRAGAGSIFTAGKYSFEVIDVDDDSIHLRYKPS